MWRGHFDALAAHVALRQERRVVRADRGSGKHGAGEIIEQQRSAARLDFQRAASGNLAAATVPFHTSAIAA